MDLKSKFILITISMILFSFQNRNAGETQQTAAAYAPAPYPSYYLSEEQTNIELSTDEYTSYLEKFQEMFTNLEYDFYRFTCPEAEQIIQTTMTQLFSTNPSVAPQLLRLVFHDCIVGGCDASVLLTETDDGSQREIDELPNETLKGFDHIETIKSQLEEACPGVVSCADILVLAARDGVFLAGGPFYPVFTGRRDSLQSHYNLTDEIPTPFDDISTILKKFRSKGFNEREMVSLLGSHNIGSMNCKFFLARIANFNETGQPDPSINPAFLPEMAAACFGGGSHLMPNGDRLDDNHYYKKVLNGSVPLLSDQQFMADSRTARLVSNYAFDDGFAFRRDFARSMVKLSTLSVLTGSDGVVRKLTCAKLST